MAKSSKKKVTKGKKAKSKKRGSRKITYHSTKEIKVDKTLTDNFIALQRVMVNLSSKFENLSSQISKLLELFEISAKALARKDFDKEENKEMKEISKKLDEIAQKTGLIGRGITLMHEVSPTRQQSREISMEPKELSEMRLKPGSMPPISMPQPMPPIKPMTMSESHPLPRPQMMPKPLTRSQSEQPGFMRKLGEREESTREFRGSQSSQQPYQRSIEEGPTREINGEEDNEEEQNA